MISNQARVCIGRAGTPVGELRFIKDGRREYSVFAYQSGWLGARERFEISPDLPLVSGHVTRRSPHPEDSCFPFALADTTPDAWGKRVLLRAHAKLAAAGPAQ